MSRSTKKPYYNDQRTEAKTTANHTVRRLKFKDTPKNGKAYKKEFNSWGIRDYSCYIPKDKKARRK